MYLVQKAEKEIKEMNQMVLFQKAKIKKRSLERIRERSQNIKGSFINTYNEFCNNFLSSNLIRTKDYALNLKNRLIKELQDDLRLKIKERIEKNYTDYIEYLVRLIEKNEKVLTNARQVEYIFNTQDFEYFTDNKKNYTHIFKDKVNIIKSLGEFIGGYKVRLPEEKISHDLSIDEIINNNLSIIEKEFTKIISDDETGKIEHLFEEFIQKQKLKIEEYIREYEQI